MEKKINDLCCALFNQHAPEKEHLERWYVLCNVEGGDIDNEDLVHSVEREFSRYVNEQTHALLHEHNDKGFDSATFSNAIHHSDVQSIIKGIRSQIEELYTVSLPIITFEASDSMADVLERMRGLVKINQAAIVVYTWEAHAPYAGSVDAWSVRDEAKKLLS